MKVRLIQIGKTDSDYLARGIDEYKKRVSHYLNIEEITLKCLDSATKQGVIAQKNAEGKLILGNVTGKEPIILLDEKGIILAKGQDVRGSGLEQHLLALMASSK